MSSNNRKPILETIERLAALAIVVGCLVVSVFHPPMHLIAGWAAVVYVRTVTRNARRR